MLKIASLSSGSRGNCTYIEGGSTSLLIDLGISCRRVCNSLEALGVNPKTLDAVLVTHSHSDHIGQAATFLHKFNIPVFGNGEAISAIKRDLFKYEMKRLSLQPLKLQGAEVLSDFFVDGLTVSPLAVSHDVPCYAYSIYYQGAKVTVMTDLGAVSPNMLNNICDSDIVMIESNHDEKMLIDNPSYPEHLKKRILSRRGHLSNSDCANAAVRLVEGGVKQLILAHLSEQNNHPELAYETVRKTLSASGIYEGRDVKIHVALQNQPTEILSVK